MIGERGASSRSGREMVRGKEVWVAVMEQVRSMGNTSDERRIAQ